MTISEFYHNIKLAVTAHDKLRTFCVIDSPTDIVFDNLKQTIINVKSDYFYSRDWAETGYDPSDIKFSLPALFVYEKPITVKNIFTLRDSATYDLQFLCINSIENKERYETSELMQECIFMLLNVLNYVQTLYPNIMIKNRSIYSNKWLSKGLEMRGVLFDVSFEDNCFRPYEFWKDINYLINGDGSAVVDSDGQVIFV